MKSVEEGEYKGVVIAEKREGIAGRFLREKIGSKEGKFSTRAREISFGKG